MELKEASPWVRACAHCGYRYESKTLLSESSGGFVRAEEISEIGKVPIHKMFKMFKLSQFDWSIWLKLQWSEEVAVLRKCWWEVVQFAGTGYIPKSWRNVQYFPLSWINLFGDYSNNQQKIVRIYNVHLRSVVNDKTCSSELLAYFGAKTWKANIISQQSWKTYHFLNIDMHKTTLVK